MDWRGNLCGVASAFWDGQGLANAWRIQVPTSSPYSSKVGSC